MRKVKFLASQLFKGGFIDYLGVDISKRSSVVAHYKNGKFKKSFHPK